VKKKDFNNNIIKSEKYARALLAAEYVFFFISLNRQSATTAAAPRIRGMKKRSE
jgi:hypothetical protein